ncbi:MAG TPA: alpha-glucan family phosphorylase [Bryobacteraceae bacterium]|nr:alpha-glucan family phosphorylase [Bryobacteraceae bacterium]
MSNLRYTNLPSETPNEDELADLALDVTSSWNRVTDALWSQLNPELWERTRNPWIVLQTVSSERLRKVTSEPAFRDNLSELRQAQAADKEAPRWFQTAHPNSPLKCVAYFSMEYMLSEALPIYSGGLGNVAGDQLKAANDLGVPVVGIGLLYSQGYFRQELDRNGGQRALYPYNDPGQLPIRPLRDANGDWLRLSIPFPGCDLWIRAWEVQVGGTKLYLLDTNDAANVPEFRGVTSELYGGGPDLRIRQEIVLGIGGWRLLRSLGIAPEVCHLNEGHAAFGVLERAGSYMDDNGHSFESALAVTRAGNLFTTHTPVEAGFDRFSPDLMYAYLGQYCVDRLKISFDELMAMGRRDPGDRGEPFNMAYLALHGSGAVNGVSRLHGAVSRSLFQPMFPRWPTVEVPVRHVTNGVHVPTWDSDDASQLWTEFCGQRCWRSDLGQMENTIRETPAERLWSLRTKARKSLVDYIRARYSRQIAVQGASRREIAEAAELFDPAALTLGFARRFATYKRPNLLLHDPERLRRILHDPQRPVQLVIAGKAHPNDGAGQAMIRQWTEFTRQAHGRPSVIFLSDYDMLMTQELVSGVDVWINTPRRPWEASGTSGMKVLVNGGLNLSELDGWWAEAYAPDIGWAIGDGREHGDDPAWDAAEAEALYGLLEAEVIPEFYQRNEAGLPEAWLARIRESMARLTPEYSANRAVRQYTEQHYVPAASAYAARADQRGKLGVELAAWQQKLRVDWNGVSFGPLKVESRDGQHHFEVAVHLGGLDPDAVHVELYADHGDDDDDDDSDISSKEPFRKLMSANGVLYSASVEAHRSASDFTARVVPYHPNASVPLEATEILWQR